MSLATKSPAFVQYLISLVDLYTQLCHYVIHRVTLESGHFCPPLKKENENIQRRAGCE